jgi:hypothetical protein
LGKSFSSCFDWNWGNSVNTLSALGVDVTLIRSWTVVGVGGGRGLFIIIFIFIIIVVLGDML